MQRQFRQRYFLLIIAVWCLVAPPGVTSGELIRVGQLASPHLPLPHLTSPHHYSPLNTRLRLSRISYFVYQDLRDPRTAQDCWVPPFRPSSTPCFCPFNCSLVTS
ncbi:hypothetical protein C8Q76DRAFT_727701 [Earliella scabrosa]|nr:hypothetical protein C8Q76DRAFT_727701 [Earliella scabrosa]